MTMNHFRRGTGPPLLLLHGLGGSSQSWSTVLEPLAAQREVIAVDLPGFGQTPPIDDVSVPRLADVVTEFLTANELLGVDVVGSSMGARLALELVRRGRVGACVSLDPGGFWSGWQRHAFYASVAASIRLIRALRPTLPAVTRTAAGRTALLAQFSARPWALDPTVVNDELQAFARSASFDALLRSLAYGPAQEGMLKGSARSPITIGWGRSDRVCFPSQAKRAIELFPDARLHWFDRCGHFPQWDRPQATVELILASTGRAA